MPETAQQAKDRRRAIRAQPKGQAYAKFVPEKQNIVGGRLIGGVENTRPQTEADIHAADLDVKKLVLDGMRKKIGTKRKRVKVKGGKSKVIKVPVYSDIKVRVEKSLQDAVVERTIEGASTLTLTIHDPKWYLMSSGVFDVDEDGKLDPVDVKLDSLWFRLVKVNPNGDTLTLTFEDREVALLRRHTKPRSVARSKRTRAQFAESLVREEKSTRIGFFAPEKNEQQPIGKVKKPKTKKTADKAKAKGINRSANLTVKGARADAEQRRNMEIVLRVAVEEDAPSKAVDALLIGCIAESQFRNVKKGDRDSVGILQLRGIHGSFNRRRNIRSVVRQFLRTGFWGKGGAITNARRHPDWSAGEVTHQVQGNGTGTQVYQMWLNEAKAIKEAWGGGSGFAASSTVSKTRIKQYRFSRGTKGQREDTWTALRRLADEVKWRCFMRNGDVWFVTEPWLLERKVQAIISRDTDGIDSSTFSFDWDTGKTVKTLSFNVTAQRWRFPPGGIIQVKNSGPADGKWIISKISKSLFKTDAEITLTKAVKPKPEPAPETETVQQPSNTRVDVGDNVKGSSGPDKVYLRALAISKKNWPYAWGGGHPSAGDPSPGQRGEGRGYDCSGYVAACLVSGGYYKANTPVPASGTFATSLGKPGRGKHFTVWANGSHTFIEFYGRKGNYADTSREAGGKSGPHMRYGKRSTAGFTPRHFDGA